MQCPNCSHTNPAQSEYCEKCGYNLSNSTHVGENKISNSVSKELDDVLFIPKKKSNALRNVIIVLGLIILFVLILALIPTDSSDPNSNVNSTLTQSSPLPLANNLALEGYKMEWLGKELYFEGILKNDNNVAVSNVIVRLDFYRDRLEKQLFDTRKVTISGAEANGAFSFQIPVYIYPSGEFWWTSKIESAQ